MLVQRTRAVELPEWARSRNAVLRYALHGHRRRSTRIPRWVGRLGVVIAICGLMALSWLAYHVDVRWVASESAWFAVLYVPLLIVQFVALMLALVWCPAAVPAAQQRGAWEIIRATSRGPEMLIFAQWTAVFYQMRALMFWLMVLRVILLSLALRAASAYQGHHLDLYTMGIPSTVPLGTAVIMLAAQLTVALIQFPVLLGLNRAISLLISAVFSGRASGGIARTVVFASEIGLFWLALRDLQHGPGVDSGAQVAGHTGRQWLDLILFGTIGDQGLRFMDLSTLLQVWTDIQYSALLGGALLAVVVVQLLATRCMLLVAAWLVARPMRK